MHSNSIYLTMKCTYMLLKLTTCIRYLHSRTIILNKVKWWISLVTVTEDHQFIFSSFPIVKRHWDYEVSNVACSVHSGLTALPLPPDDGEDNRIIGGSRAPVGSWPAIVSLYKDGVHDCGGTVISPQFVMVAAHCMK